MKFAVCVTFNIIPDHWDQFLKLMNENAANSLANEEGCIQFDVCTDEACPHEAFLYEIYTSPEAFRLHLQSDHFRSFDLAVSSMIKDKHIKTYSRVK
ncbi:MAG: putative quinol monooxygenase [Pseudomonadota bacterium]